jgi:hypothetical protein
MTKGLRGSMGAEGLSSVAIVALRFVRQSFGYVVGSVPETVAVSPEAAVDSIDSDDGEGR